MIAGKDAYIPGEAKNSLLTGSASWNYYTITQYIQGIQPHYNGLKIDPRIPIKWKGFDITCKTQSCFKGNKIFINKWKES